MKRLAGVILIIGWISGVVMADDVLPPPWRGQPRTLHAKWDTWTGNPGMPADTVEAPGLSEPTAYIDGTGTAVEATYQGRTKVLVVDPEDTFEFTVSNFVGGDQKTVWVQFTYYGDAYITPSVQMVSPSRGPKYAEFQGHVGSANKELLEWRTDAFSFSINPNPVSEVFKVSFFRSTDGLTFTPTTVYLDQVNVDTICPEPASVALLALGGLSLMRRRR